MSKEQKESTKEQGLLLVVTGTSASGKDAVCQDIVNHEKTTHLNLRMVVTAASREKRKGEVHGKDYWFYELEQMRRMERDGLFVEPLTQTGGPGDWKATEKKEILPILSEGRSVIWRIDLSRAAEVAKGGYFDKYLDPATACIIESRTVVVKINPDSNLSYNDIMEIRRKRDGVKFDRSKYEERDRLEEAILSEHGHHFKHVIENKWMSLSSTVDNVANLILQSFDVSK